MPGTVITPVFRGSLTRTQSQVIRVLPETSPSWSWRNLTWPAVALAVAVPALAIFQPWQTTLSGGGHSESAHSASPTSTQPRTVNVTHPQQALAGSVLLPATIRPWQSTALNARVSGYLKSWHVELGAQVKAGQVLAEIETPELDQEVAEGQAQAAEAAAAAVQAQAERTEAEAELNVSLAQLARVQSEMELASSQLARREKLLANRAVSREEFDTFQKHYEARVADVTAAQADVARRRTSLDTRAAVIAARQATAHSRQANVERLKELQGFQKIVAPFAGLVTRRSAEVGMLVTAGSEPLFVIEDLSRVRVQVNVPQTNAAQLTVGAAATINVPESGQPAIQGHITRIAGAIDANNRTMLAEIELDNTEARLQPGSYAQVSLATLTSSTAWTVPVNTVQMKVEGPHVAIVNDQNAIELTPVTLGRDHGSHVQVTAGLRGNERLVINPPEDLTSGSIVKVNEPKRVAQR